MVIPYGRTSDGGNGNHSVSLLIILIKIKVDQMLLSSYISSKCDVWASQNISIWIFVVLSLKSFFTV